MRLEPGPGPLVRREPGFDIGQFLPPYEPEPAVGLPPRVLVTGAEFPPNWPVWDQQDLESCTAQAAAAALMFLQLAEAHKVAPDVDDPQISPSRDFLWYQAQRVMRQLGQDVGVWVRVAIHCLRRFGACSDALWRSLPERYQDHEQWVPAMQEDLRVRGVLAAAAKARPLAAYHLGADAHDPDGDHAHAKPRDIEPMKRCLQDGFPFVMAVVWYTRYEPKDYASGDFPLPAKDSESREAGHTLLVVGYDDEFTSPDGDYRGPRWLVRNSRGTDSGHDGYASLPYEWATNPHYSHGLWTLRRGSPEAGGVE